MSRTDGSPLVEKLSLNKNNNSDNEIQNILSDREKKQFSLSWWKYVQSLTVCLQSRRPRSHYIIDHLKKKTDAQILT